MDYEEKRKKIVESRIDEIYEQLDEISEMDELVSEGLVSPWGINPKKNSEITKKLVIELENLGAIPTPEEIKKKGKEVWQDRIYKKYQDRVIAYVAKIEKMGQEIEENFEKKNSRRRDNGRK